MRRSARIRPAVALMTIAASVLLAVIGANSMRWIGRTFPSFLVMKNRVVASAALGDWLTLDPAHLFQHQVIAVDGTAVRTSEEVYDYAQRHPPGTVIVYRLREPSGVEETVAVPSRRFSGWDHLRLFGAYLVVGVSFIVSGLLVFQLMPKSAAGAALLSCGLAVGGFALTGIDLYGPHWFFRLHIAAEILAPATLIHLALTFPIDRLQRRRRWILTGLYVPFGLLAILYQAVFFLPTAYTRVHLIAMAAQGAGAAAPILSATWSFVASPSPLVRRRVGIVALGTLAAFVVPGIIGAVSVLVGGSVAVNLAAFTVFLFPLSLGYAVLKHDLFEIDSVLRHAISYAIVGLVMGAVYLTAILLAGALIPIRELLASAPVVLAVLNLALVFLVVPIRVRVQQTIDHLFFRKAFSTQEALAQFGSTLAGLQTIDAVVASTCRTLAETLCPVSSALYLDEGAASLIRQGGTDGSALPEIALPPDLAARAGQGEVLARYEWDDGSGREVPAVWQALDAELIVPIRDRRGLAGILVVGRRQSGRVYTAEDVTFLRTLTNQVALAVEDARLLQQLERKQASLIRADRLATLGRLASGLAHEMGSPLGAVLNSLRVLTELGREYAASVDAPTVLPEDHRQIAEEIVSTALKATEWTEKASTFLKRVNMHGRDPGSVRQPFTLATVVADTRALLSHRLNAASCRVDFEEQAPDLVVMGDPAKLGQVLANLFGNALDAYEERGSTDRRLAVRAYREGRTIVLAVQDWAGGMPAHVFARIFDELYTTKDPGRGTGLGLWISRNLIEESFAGTLQAETTEGEGTRFLITFPPPEGVAGLQPPGTPDADRAASAVRAA